MCVCVSNEYDAIAIVNAMNEEWSRTRPAYIR